MGYITWHGPKFDHGTDNWSLRSQAPEWQLRLSNVQHPGAETKEPRNSSTKTWNKLPKKNEVLNLQETRKYVYSGSVIFFRYCFMFPNFQASLLPSRQSICHWACGQNRVARLGVCEPVASLPGWWLSHLTNMRWDYFKTQLNGKIQKCSEPTTS